MPPDGTPAMSASHLPYPSKLAPVRSMAWPLALCWVALIVYASLYPFQGWRSAHIPWWAVPMLPWLRYWTWLDVISNLIGYIPLGFLLALGVVRSGWGGRWQVLLAVALAVLGGALLSLGMETAQRWLPARVPSSLDWLLNSAGTGIGALLVAVLHQAGVVQHWHEWRKDWLLPDAYGALVLVLLWLVALLYPTQIPFGLGQAWQRLSAHIGHVLADTAWADTLPPLHYLPPTAQAESAAIAAGLLIPVLLLFAVVPRPRHRAVAWLWLMAGALLIPTLIQGLLQGATLALDWLQAPAVRTALLAATALALLCLWLPARACLWLILPALGLELLVVNTIALSDWHAALLGRWRLAGFIHFYGITRWIALLWPYMMVAYILQRIYLYTPLLHRSSPSTAPAP